MVSKITKRTPTKPPSRRRRRTSSSPLKALAAAPSLVAASIDRSLRSCRRRLVKIFTRLTILSTPKKTTPHKRIGFRRLNSISPNFDDIDDDTAVAATTTTTGPKPLPPLNSPEKRTVFLDLDETLIHSQTGLPPLNYDFTVHPTIDGDVHTFYVLKRPGVDELLRSLSQSFELVVFTAGVEEYASLVLDRLDPDGDIIAHRLYRDSCREMEGGRFVKDLAGTGRDLGRVVIVDDNPNAYSLHPENAVPIAPFVDDLADEELRRVMKFFEEKAPLFDDLRDAVAHYHLSESRVEENPQDCS